MDDYIKFMILTIACTSLLFVSNLRDSISGNTIQSQLESSSNPTEESDTKDSIGTVQNSDGKDDSTDSAQDSDGEDDSTDSAQDSDGEDDSTDSTQNSTVINNYITIEGDNNTVNIENSIGDKSK